MADNGFRFSNSILTTKEYQDDVEREYIPFFNNKVLSQHIDCIMHVNTMNINHELSPKEQYDYLFHVIRKMKRKFGKWGKKIVDDDIPILQDYFGYNYNKAKAAKVILTKEQIKHIKDMMK
jgi:hypothetical protein